MLDRPRIIKSINKSIDILEWQEWLTDRDEEELACLNELINAVNDQSIDDLAFQMGLDSHLYWI
jgi:predicted house-cleaning noncanonical NTP pyrophosphatase (MazG superfamily)